MADIERFLGPGSRIQEIGFTTDDTIPDSYAFQVDATPEKPFVLRLQITAVTIRQPIVKFLQNPILGEPGKYQCSFAATHRLIEYTGEACDPTSKHYGKLFGGFGFTIHRGERHLHRLYRKMADEDLNHEEREFSADFVQASGGKLVSGLMVLNPGWEYNNAGSARRDIEMPLLMATGNNGGIGDLLPGNGAIIRDTTVIEVKNTFFQEVAMPNGVWEFTRFASRQEMPPWGRASYNYRIRSTTHHGEDLADGLSLCYDPLTLAPETPEFQMLPYETKFRLFIEVSKALL